MTVEVSPLRRARLARNATLEQVVEALDLRAPGGSSGVTASMLSGWERGRRRTTARHRAALCDLYGQPVEVLFAHQDGATGGGSPALLVGFRDLAAAMAGVVARAERYLLVTGSRSRDVDYLGAIEEAVADRPNLVHYRVLFGPPHHEVLRRHLLRLLELRDPDDRSQGVKTLHIGLVEDTVAAPERFVCVSEREAVVPIASLSSADAFDSGVHLGRREAERLIEHVRQCYAGARKLESPDAVLALPIIRERPDRPRP